MTTLEEQAVALESAHHWIGGKLVESQSGRTATIWNPATGKARANVGLASVAEVDQAVSVAKGAFTLWRVSTLSRRAEVMFKMRPYPRAAIGSITAWMSATTVLRTASMTNNARKERAAISPPRAVPKIQA